MRVCDLSEDAIKVGLRVKSLVSDRMGTVVAIDEPPADMYSWILWDGDDQATSGFYWNQCDCEVAEPTRLTDVHTEHCCALHGCKYANDACTVYSRHRKQSHPCEECGYTERINPETVLFTRCGLWKDPIVNMGHVKAILARAFNIFSNQTWITASTDPVDEAIQKYALLYLKWIRENMFSTEDPYEPGY